MDLFSTVSTQTLLGMMADNGRLSDHLLGGCGFSKCLQVEPVCRLDNAGVPEIKKKEALLLLPAHRLTGWLTRERGRL